MKIALGLLAALTAAAAGAAGLDTSKITISGETNRSALSYQPGDEMVYTFKADLDGQPADGLFLSWKRRGDDGKTESGRSPANQPLVVRTSLDRPGFVSVDVTLTDADGKAVRHHFTNQAGQAKSRTITFYGGTGVQAETLTDCGEPADFDAFWAKQKQRLAAVPFKDGVTLKKVKTVNGVDIYAVSIPCAGPRPVTGYLQVPVGAQPKSLPGLVTFRGYGTGIQQPPKTADRRYLKLDINAHGQELGREPEYYREFFKSIRSGKYNYAFDPEQNADPERAFFNGMALRVLRALEYVKSRPEWNGRDLVASGGSQGGLQTMWAAALDPNVTAARPSVTWCCDLAGTAKKQRISGPWRLEYVPALDYYDPVFMAKRISKARVDITRAGLGDYTCPPSGLAVCYNNLATPHKSIRWVQGSSHGFVPEKSEVIIWRTSGDAGK